MPFADKDFPSSQAFDLIDQVLRDQDTRNDMMKSAKAVFAFDLTSPDGSKQVPPPRIVQKILTFGRKAGTST
jgi:hypothetical protein